MPTSRIVLAAGLFCLLSSGIPSFGQTRDGAGQPFGQPARDTSSLDPTTGLATLSGRVLRSDTGAVVKRAMVRLAGQDTRDRRTVQTDENGRYQFTDLQAGRYTVTVSKAGLISLAYGQKHPRQPALPIQVDAGRRLRNVDIALPRGSVITGQVVDEDGEPMARAVVQVLRYVYRQGQRQIEPAGTDQTDDRGQYRVFDLEPGEYFVSVTLPRRRGGFGGRWAGWARRARGAWWTWWRWALRGTRRRGGQRPGRGRARAVVLSRRDHAPGRRPAHGRPEPGAERRELRRPARPDGACRRHGLWP